MWTLLCTRCHCFTVAPRLAVSPSRPPSLLRARGADGDRADLLSALTVDGQGMWKREALTTRNSDLSQSRGKVRKPRPELQRSVASLAAEARSYSPGCDSILTLKTVLRGCKLRGNAPQSVCESHIWTCQPRLPRMFTAIAFCLCPHRSCIIS